MIFPNIYELFHTAKIYLMKMNYPDEQNFPPYMFNSIRITKYATISFHYYFINSIKP